MYQLTASIVCKFPILGAQKRLFTAAFAGGARRRTWSPCEAERLKAREAFVTTKWPLSSSYGTYVSRRSLLMLQFEKIKKQYAEYALLFQVGDFYELYGDDATDVASKTSLRLTRKSGIPMAGFPVRSLEEWQRTLVEAGFQLAICKQIPASNTDGKLRLLGREVVKLVTPGTLTEPLDQRANYLMSIITGPAKTVGLAWIDISTSDFQVSSSEVENVDEDLERICPSEVLLSEALVAAIKEGASYDRKQQHPATECLLKSSLLKECHLTPIPDSWYSEEGMESDQLLEMLGSLKTGEFSTLEISAAAALLHFVMHTQRSVIPFLSPPSRFSHHQHMAIDANTRRALEIVSPLHSNPKKTTLLGCIDRTVTAAGARLLQARLSSPLTDVQAIKSRLATVELFFTQMFHCEALVDLLKSCSDLERIIQKIATDSATWSDLQAVKNTLITAGEILQYIETIPDSEALAENIESLQPFPMLIEELDRAVGGEKYGDFILKGYSSEVDSLREKIRLNEREVGKLVNLLRSDSGAAKLIAAPHKSYGRVLEVPKGQVSLADKYKELIRVDETQGKKRYTHIELQRLNAEMLELDGKYSETQEQLFQELCNKVMSQAQELVQTARALARLDVSTSLGLMAADREYCMPEVTGDPVFSVTGGEHPVVATLQKGGFVSNNCNMDEQRLWIVTGPNMGGKSTFLRQNALIAILAQMGSFVPAEEATIGVVDRLFARVGASDNVARHMSTFHMEMTETANILINATPRSFIILDEVGRGTATSEGLSIAQAVAEHLHNKIDCRVLLATHFHQLAALSRQLPNAACHKLVAKRSASGIVFTYKIMPGQADHSFGIDVAKLAGIPHEVIHRAQELLIGNNSVETVSSDMTSALSGCVPTPGNDAQEHGTLMQSQRVCIRKLEELSLDHITPVEALNFLAEVKHLLQSNAKDPTIVPMQL